MKKNKILFILHLPPPIHGAGVVGQIIKESTIVNENFEASFVNLSTSKSIEEIGKKGFHKIVSLIKLLFSVLIQLVRYRFKLVYVTLNANGAGFYKDLLTVAVLKLFRKQIVFHFHNNGVALNNSKIRKRLYQFAFSKTSCIILSNRLKKDYINYFQDADIYVCANGIHDLKFDVVENRPFKENNIAPTQLLFLSNMSEEKGPLILLEACNILKERGLSFNCHFAGAWGDISAINFQQKTDSYNLTDNIITYGITTGKSKELLYKKADIFIFPSYNESFGLVLLEAMQSKLPVIACHEGGIPDIVQNEITGFLVPKKNALELANKIEFLIHHPDQGLKMGQAGYDYYKAHYTINAFEQRFNQILLTLTNKNS